MRKYETIFIAQPELGEEDLKGLTEKVQEVITSMKGECTRLEDWGIRKLAYPVKKCFRGRYFYVNFAGNAALIAELERRLRLDDKVIRYQSVKLEKEAEVVPVVEEKPVQDAPAEEAAESATEE
ncbi:MAG: rpsF [Geobacteraceae bacterium]|jgi:small subunit ribosomal protein S6|nr:rpsF [Geobacteraceae bacterium]